MPSSPRLRDLGLAVGPLPAGATNSIVDVPGVRVGHCNVRGPAAAPGGKPVHTGVSVIVPGAANLFEHPLPAAVDIFNGFGKSAGLVQVAERGQIETPLYLASTLNVGRIWDAALTVALEENPKAISINPVVLECNDGVLSDGRLRPCGEPHVREALAAARRAATGAAAPAAWEAATLPAPAMGTVGAGSGMLCLGRKGGIGSSSRIVATKSMGPVAVGVLTMNNFGGRLRWAGREISAPKARGQDARGTHGQDGHATGDPPCAVGGSAIVVLATNAPLAPDVLRRVARRAWAGVARTGAAFSDTSGDIALAFALPDEGGLCPDELLWRLPTEDTNALFAAAADATEESIWDCLLAAGDFTTSAGKTIPGLRAEELLAPANEAGNL